MRVCFLGNSHIVPVARAWMEVSHKFDTTFLAGPGTLLRSLTLSNGKLVSKGRLRELLLDATGVADAVVAEFDIFIVVGLQFEMNACVRLFTLHRPWREDRANMEASDRWFPSSRSFLRQAMRERLRQSVAMTLIDALRTETSAPILVIDQPRLSDRVLGLDSQPTAVWRELYVEGRESEVRSIYEEARAALDTELEILEQPAETIRNEILTVDRYDSWWPGKGPVRYFDLSHMNVEYGRLVVQTLLERLRPA